MNKDNEVVNQQNQLHHRFHLNTLVCILDHQTQTLVTEDLQNTNNFEEAVGKNGIPGNGGEEVEEELSALEVSGCNLHRITHINTV